MSWGRCRFCRLIFSTAAIRFPTELGFIRFGSRVDLYLPLDTQLQVKLNEKVKGSQTIIGKI